MEGQRPMLVEIQALVAPTSLGTPRRAVVGFDPARLSMILAVLEAHGGLKLGMHDVYLNVAGGMQAGEPAADLAAAAALASSLTGAVLPPEQVYFGEIGLSGAIRPVIHAAQRLKEAGKLGFKSAVLPQAQQTGDEDRGARLTLRPCADVGALVADIARGGTRASREPPKRALHDAK
jgi:DNA repair protein RadA/Sms